MSDSCIHYKGHENVCAEGVDIRAHVGGSDVGWVWRMPCLPNRAMARRLEIVACEKFTPYTNATDRKVAELLRGSE